MEDLGLGLARFWGILIAVLSLAMLANRKMLEGMKQSKQDYALIFVLGLIALIAGALQVSFYNVWELNYRGLVTLMGWVTLVRAALRLFVPDSNKRAMESARADWMIYPTLLATAALGLYLTAVGVGLAPGGVNLGAN